MSIPSEIKRHQKKYPDIPVEAIIKQDILRLGIQFSKDSCHIASGYKPKDYFIFSFDLVTLDELEKEGNHLLNAPEEVRFFGGESDLQPTIFSVRLNPKSPYKVEILEGKLALTHNSKYFSDVDFHPYPSYYQSTLTSGKTISQIAPVLEWGYLIYLTVFRLCQYWGEDEECQFCDINENYRQQKKAGREYTGIKDIDDILEALEHISKKDTVSKAITVTGGSITKTLNGKKEVDFYLEYTRAIREKFKDRWIIKAGVEAFDKEECRRLHIDGGVEIYHPNYEIWDESLFKRFCPGKERYVGRDQWMQRIVDAADIFGPNCVIPNFVAGVEMAQPNGFKDLHEAVASAGQGLEFFMSKSIVPRFTTWCQEPLSYLQNTAPPPLEYYVKLLQTWRDIFEKYQLPVPPGYGEAGVGKAVFSVSAFMDVIRI